jgi:hypothetical protein
MLFTSYQLVLLAITAQDLNFSQFLVQLEHIKILLFHNQLVALV